MTRIRSWAIWLVLWVAIWLGVGETLYRGAGWDRTLSGFVGIAAASAGLSLIEGRRRDRTSPTTDARDPE